MSKKASQQKSLRSQSHRFALEPRIVFDAVIPVAGAEIIDHFAEHQTATENPHAEDHIVAPAVETAAAPKAPEKESSPAQTTAATDDATHADVSAVEIAAVERALIPETLASANLSAHEIIFIDAAVAGLQQYILDHPQADVVLLDATKDGMDQIAAVLAGRSDITAIHILSHGAAGQLFLGNSTLDLTSISGKYAADLAIIKGALDENADILIYGCDVAAGADGLAFENALATATGADIAASIDTTGATDLGGNWTLESHTATIEAKGLQLNAWQGTLAATNTAVGGAWVFGGTAAAPTATNTTDGIKTTVTFTAVGTAWTALTVQTLNNIAAFSNAAQNTADFTTVFNGTSGTVTIVFDKTVINPVLHIDRIGGALGQVSNSSLWTLANAGLSLTKIAGTASLLVTGTTFQREQNITQIGTVSTESSLTNTAGTAAGSIQINGTIAAGTVITFNISGPADGLEIAFALDAAPITKNDAFVTNEDITLTSNLYADNGSGVDSDARADAMTVNTINGTVVTVNTPITLTNGVLTVTNLTTGAFTFVPNAGFSGVQTFTYDVKDPLVGTGPTAASNISNTSTVTITINSVNDAPAGTDKTIAINEDATYTVTAADFGFSDVNDTPANAFANVIVSSIPSAAEGVYKLNGVAITVGQVITVANINAGLLIFTPATNFNGALKGALGFKVQDNGGIANGGVDTDPTANTLNFTIAAVNDAPTVTMPAPISTPEDTPIVIAGLSFADVDVSSGSVDVTITITSGTLNWVTTGFISTTGSTATSLKLSGQLTAINNALTAGKLSYTPVADFNNSLGGVVTLTVAIDDKGNTGSGGALSASANTTINVTPVVDITNDAVTTNEDTAIVFNTLTGLNVSGGVGPNNTGTADNFEGAPSVTAVTQGAHGTVSFTAAGALTYTPALNYNGTDTFTYTVTSGGVTETATVTVTINNVNDAPAGTDKTITTLSEDTAYTVLVGDFGFSDVDGNAFTNVLITSIPNATTDGVYTLNGLAIAVNQVITVADINAGKLVFTPAANVNGLKGALGFKVIDNGGTLNGGVDTDPIANILNFNIIPVNDVVTLSGLNDGTVAGTDAQVKESDLASGTNPAGTGENATGTFNLGPASSLTSLTINGGATITLAQLTASGTTPITRTTANGTLTISGYNTATGVVTYSYLLTSAANHTGNITVNDNFVIATTDVEGDIVSGTLAINILDDAPIANADVDEAFDSVLSAASGNVVTGVGGTDFNAADGVADKIGADTPINPVTGVAVGAGVPSAGNLGIGIFGAHGTLTLNANGSYSYVPFGTAGLAPGQTVTDTFTYAIADNDGDAATTTLTITIVGVPAIIGLNDGSVAGTDNSVLESDLAAGTNAVGTGETATGSFQLVTTTPVVSFTIDPAGPAPAVTLTIAQLNALTPATPQTITTANGVLKLTGFNQATGQLNYQYTLTTPPNSAVAVTDDFQVSLIDLAGNNTSTANAFLKIAIIDDAPIGTADTNTIAENTVSIAGTVITNDKIGADGASTTPFAGPVTGLVAGTGAVTAGTLSATSVNNYGSIAIAADGSYTYTLNNANATVDALKVGQTLTDTYTYQITDGDGDTVTTTLTITINGANDNPVDGNEIATVTEDVTLTVPAATGLLANTTDVDGGAPSITSFLVAGNAVPFTVTAGTPGVANIVGVGVLTINSDGSYSFAPALNYTGAIPIITYTVSDGAGGTDPSTLTLSITPVNDPPVATPNSITPTEDTPISVPLAGTDVDGTIATITITAGPTPAQGALVYDDDGLPGTPPVAVPLNTALTPAQAASVQFVPALNYNGPVNPVTFFVTDNNGAPSTAANVTINNVIAVNDPPVATPNSITPTEDTPISVPLAGTDVDGTIATITITAGPTPAQGSLVYDDDGLPGTPPVAVPLNTALTPAQAASVQFVPALNYNGPVNPVTFFVTDNNGVPSTAANVTINNVIAVNDNPVDGNETATVTEDITLTVPAATGLLANTTDVDGGAPSITSFLVAGNAVPFTVTAGTPGVANIAGVGVLTINSDGSYSFAPALNYTGAIPVVTYTVSDGAGGTDTSTLTLSITPVNDPPVATPFNTTVNEDTPATLNLTGTDVDGTVASVTVPTLPLASQGVLTLANGNPVLAGQVLTPLQAATLIFTPALNFNGTVTIPFIVTDNTGASSVSANAVINITPVNDVITFADLTDGTVGGTDAQVKESDLASGTNPTGTGENTSSTFNLGPASALTSLTINGGATITLAQLTASGTTPIVSTGTNGTLTISGYNPATGVVTYSYLLTSAANHTAGNVNDNFVIATTDIEGDIVSGTLAINILDDVPVANADVDEATNLAGNPSSTASGNVFTGVGGIDPNAADGIKDVIGADGALSAIAPVTGVVAGAGTPLAGNLGGTGITTALGNLILNADGSYIYTPNYAAAAVIAIAPGASLTDTFTYSIADSDGDSVTTTLTISIVGVPAIIGLNDGTVAGTDGSVLESDLAAGTNAAGTGEAVSGSFQLLSPAFPVAELHVGGTTILATQFATLSISPVTITTANGTLVLNGYNAITGTINYTYTLITPPNSAVAVTDDFAVYLVDSAANSTAGANAFLKIAIIDDAPIANADSATITENTASVSGTVITNDKIGADGASTLPVGPVTGLIAGTGVPVPTANVGSLLPGNYGSITLGTNGAYTYTLDNLNPSVNGLKAGETLIETYTYQITDKDGDTATAVLTITINGANDAPTLVLDTNTTNEDTPVSGNVLTNDSDVDLDTLTVTQFTVSILGVPTVITVPAGGTGTANITNVGTLQINSNGNYTFTPVLNFNGAVPQVTYSVSDGTVTASTTLDISVTPVNDAPVAIDDGTLAVPLLIAEDGTLTLNLVGNDTDVDGDTLTVQSINGTTLNPLGTPTGPITVPNGTVNVSALGVITFTPTANYNGPVTFDYVVQDRLAGGLTDTGTVNISVTPVPDIVADTATATEDTPVTIDVLANDSFGTGAVITAINGSAITDGGASVAVTNGSVALVAGKLVFTPAPDFNGTVPTFTYTVTAGGVTETANVVVTVTAVADITNDTLATTEDTPITVNVITGTNGATADTFSDPTRAVTAVTQGANGTVTFLPNGTITYTPNANFNGTDTYTYTVTSGGVTETATVTVNVAAVVDLTATDDTATTNEDTPVTSTVATGDSTTSGGVLSYAKATDPAHGTVTVAADGTYTYTPAANYNGADSFTYTVTDPASGESLTRTVNLTVNSVNDPPVATPATASGTSEKGIPIRLTGTDIDGTIAGVTLQTLPPASQGVLTLADGTPVVAGALLTPAQAAGLIFKPNAGFKGVASFSFTVTDNNGAESLPASANVTVVLADTGLFEQLITQPNKFGGNEENPFNIEIKSPLAPIGMPEDLFVSFSVNESSNQISANSNFGVFNADTPSLNEIQNFTFDLKGLPVGMDSQLFVQHAIHGTPLTATHNNFVQNAVRQSQIESTSRNIGVKSFNSANPAVSDLLSPFEIGALNTQLENAKTAQIDEKSKSQETKRNELALLANEVEVMIAKDVTIERTHANSINKHIAMPKLAAPSFANQLKMAANKYKQNTFKEKI